ncbi:MAG: hypothetical protein ACRCWM_13340 [Sarcina sp.]
MASSNYKSSQKRSKQDEIMRENMRKREKAMTRGAIMIYVIIAALVGNYLPHLLGTHKKWFFPIYLLIMILTVVVVEFIKLFVKRIEIKRAIAKGTLKRR